MKNSSLRKILTCVLASSFLVSCSKEEEVTTSTAVTPSSPTYSYSGGDTSNDVVIDATSSATVLDEAGYGDTSYQVFHKVESYDDLLLEGYPTADYLVFQALATTFKLDSNEPIEVIHQSVKESLGSRYESVRSSYDLITRDAYNDVKKNSDNLAGVRDYYSVGFEDLSNNWFEGLTSSEATTMKEHILHFYEMNDLLQVTHYSYLEGLDSLVDYVILTEKVTAYISALPEESREEKVALVNRILFEPETVSQDDYTTFVTDSVTVRDLLESTTSLGSHFQEILHDEWNLNPRRIGYFGSDRHYGMSAIEFFDSNATSTSTQYANVVISPSNSNVSSKTARLYLPKLGSEEYLVLTIQEIIFDEENMFAYIGLETASISTFNTLMAQDLHNVNVATLSSEHGLTVVQSGTTESTDSGATAEDLSHDDHDDHDVELDGMSSATPEYHTVSSSNGSGGTVSLNVPHFAEKIVVLDYNFFDFTVGVGIFDRYEYLMIQDGMPEVLKPSLLGDSKLSTAVNSGDLSEIVAFAPDVIYISKDYVHLYSELSAIAPVVLTELNQSAPYSSFVENVNLFATVFMVEETMQPTLDGYAPRLATLKTKASGKSAVLVSVSGGVMTVNDSDGGMIFNELGMNNLGSGKTTVTMADIEGLNPDYLFILDMDGSATASATVPTTMVNVDAWTVLNSGLLGMDQILKDLEKALG